MMWRAEETTKVKVRTMQSKRCDGEQGSEGQGIKDEAEK